MQSLDSNRLSPGRVSPDTSPGDGWHSGSERMGLTTCAAEDGMNSRSYLFWMKNR